MLGIHSGPILYTYLGSTYGNCEKRRRINFLRSVNSMFSANQSERNGDYLLLGLDLVGEEERMLAMYDNPPIMALRHNYLTVLNRELGANFNADAYKVIVKWSRMETEGKAEAYFVSKRQQHVVIPPLDSDDVHNTPVTVVLEEEEPLLLAISVKFTREGIETELREAGMQLCAWLTDVKERFALALARKQQ